MTRFGRWWRIRWFINWGEPKAEGGFYWFGVFLAHHPHFRWGFCWAPWYWLVALAGREFRFAEGSILDYAPYRSSVWP